MIKFQEDGHKYSNIDPNDNFEWISATKLIHQFVEPFDAIAVSEKCSKGKNPKYSGKDPADIRAMWNKESKRSTDLGSWYHNQREKDMLQFKFVTRDGIEIPIIKPVMSGKIKLAPEQKIGPGLYPEHFVYLRSASVCGQADRIEVIGDTVHVFDYKTNKEIKRKGHEFWDGTVKKMLGPLRHLDDCELNTYTLQLSLYMYIIIKHNPMLKPGNIQIQHVQFEIDRLDENGYPVHALNPVGEPIISKIELIDLPYLKKEVLAMLKWLKINKEMLLHNEH
jgi:hypothetical protein